MRQTLRWAAVDSTETEELVLQTEGGGIVADAVVSGVQGGDGTDVTYHLELDPRWQVLRLSVTEGDREVDLTRDSRGTWRDAGGAVLPELQGCADVDISVTPFTSTLSIRRLQLAEGESAEIRVAYVQVPGLVLRPVRQRYTNLGGGRYRYEALDGGYTAVLSVDESGFVLEYPGRFRRLP